MNREQCPLKFFEEKPIVFLASQPFPQKNKRAEGTIVLPTRLTYSIMRQCYLNLELGTLDQRSFSIDNSSPKLGEVALAGGVCHKEAFPIADPLPCGTPPSLGGEF